MAKTSNAKKINVMIHYQVLTDLKTLLPPGKRSGFINDAVEKQIALLKRKIACDNIDKLREKLNVYATTEEIIKLRDYGRK